MAGVGLAERAERLILTFVALAVYPLSAELAHAVCLILLLLIVVTVIQRILHVYRTLAGPRPASFAPFTGLRAP